MIADTLRHRPFLLTAGGILLGTALIATRSVPLAAIGVALIMAGILTPLLRFLLITNTVASSIERADQPLSEAPSSTASPAVISNPARAPMRSGAEVEPG